MMQRKLHWILHGLKQTNCVLITKQQDITQPQRWLPSWRRLSAHKTKHHVTQRLNSMPFKSYLLLLLLLLLPLPRLLRNHRWLLSQLLKLPLPKSLKHRLLLSLLKL